jgi:hypothetical protein
MMLRMLVIMMAKKKHDAKNAGNNDGKKNMMLRMLLIMMAKKT